MADSPMQPAGELARLNAVRAIEHHNEFVAADPTDQVARSHKRVEICGKCFEHHLLEKSTNSRT
ncbi:hypothetical protein ABIA30_005505 [Mycobacterium sp. MAA66]